MTVDPAGSGAPMSDRMQSLLSRAAEDQLAEQRQLAGALTELRAQLQQIGGAVASLREGGGGGSAEAALASLSADIREAVRLLAERLDGVARLVQQRGSDLVELNAATASLQSAVRGHGEALAGIGSGLAALPSFGDRIGGLQDNLGALHERLAGLQELNTTIGTLQQRVEAVDHGLRELRSAFAAIGARMAELPGRADLDALAARTAAPVTALSERFEATEQALAGLPETLAGLAAPEAPADSGIDRLDARLEQMAATHREVTAATRDRLSALENKIDDVLAALEPADVDDEVDEAAGAEDHHGDDAVLAELAELREALLGDGGIAERLEAGTDEDLDAKVAGAVERAVGASEERLAAHIDEAVLALAEAMLRRRTSRAGARPSAAAQAMPAVASIAPPAPVTPVTPVAPVAAPAVDDEDDADGDRAGDGDAHAEQSDDASPPWQTPPGESATEPSAEREVAGEDGSRRRRPWWRPGD